MGLHDALASNSDKPLSETGYVGLFFYWTFGNKLHQNFIRIVGILFCLKCANSDTVYSHREKIIYFGWTHFNPKSLHFGPCCNILPPCMYIKSGVKKDSNYWFAWKSHDNVVLKVFIKILLNRTKSWAILVAVYSSEEDQIMKYIGSLSTVLAAHGALFKGRLTKQRDDSWLAVSHMHTGRWYIITTHGPVEFLKCRLPHYYTQIAKFMGPTWGPPGSSRPQMGPTLLPGTLLSGYIFYAARPITWQSGLYSVPWNNYLYGNWTRLATSLWAHDQNHLNIPLIPKKTIQSKSQIQVNCRGLCKTVTWLARIGSLKFKLKQREFSQDFNHEFINSLWYGSHIAADSGSGDCLLVVWCTVFMVSIMQQTKAWRSICPSTVDRAACV